MEKVFNYRRTWVLKKKEITGGGKIHKKPRAQMVLHRGEKIRENLVLWKKKLHKLEKGGTSYHKVSKVGGKKKEAIM